MSITSLPSRFTPSPSCFSKNLWQVWSDFSASSTTTNNWWWQLGPPINSDCYPPSYTPAATAYYSPAQCPSGFTPINQITSTYVGSVVETTQTCCPSDLPFSGHLGTATQSSQLARFPQYLTMACTYAITSSTHVTGTKSSAGSQGVYTDSIRSGGGINAYGIVVRFQSTDFPDSSTTTPPPNPSETPSTTSPVSSSSGSGGMSTGAKAGIGIGAVLGVVAAILGIAALVWYRRRKRRLASIAYAGRGDGLESAAFPLKGENSWRYTGSGHKGETVEELPTESLALADRAEPQELDSQPHREHGR